MRQEILHQEFCASAYLLCHLRRMYNRCRQQSESAINIEEHIETYAADGEEPVCRISSRIEKFIQ